MKFDMQTVQNSTEPKSVLVVGASGRTGVACLEALHKYPNTSIHAFCRDASKLSAKDIALCSSVVQGNARSASDLEKALLETKADVVIISVGNGDSVKKSDIRTVSGEALASIMKKPEFHHLQVMVVSSTGAGSSKIIVGLGIGKLISYHLKHVLKDHTGQEMAFASPEVKRRTSIVRASALVDNKATGKLATYGDKVKAPTIETDRADLAQWIAKKVCGPADEFGGQVTNVTSVKV